MNSLDFFTPIEFNVEEKTFKHHLIENIESYFNLDGLQKAYVISGKDIDGSQEVEIGNSNLNTNQRILYAAIKIATYATVVIPLIMMVSKIAFRMSHQFHVYSKEDIAAEKIQVTWRNFSAMKKLKSELATIKEHRLEKERNEQIALNQLNQQKVEEETRNKMKLIKQKEIENNMIMQRQELEKNKNQLETEIARNQKLHSDLANQVRQNQLNMELTKQNEVKEIYRAYPEILKFFKNTDSQSQQSRDVKEYIRVMQNEGKTPPLQSLKEFARRLNCLVEYKLNKYSQAKQTSKIATKISKINILKERTTNWTVLIEHNLV